MSEKAVDMLATRFQATGQLQLVRESLADVLAAVTAVGIDPRVVSVSGVLTVGAPVSVGGGGGPQK